MKLSANPFLLEINNYKPGKAKVGNKKVVKLSSNENALGSSLLAARAFVECASDLKRYPDGSCFELRKAIASHNKIDVERIVCGAGSDEIISLLTSAFAGLGDEIIYSEHGFLMYPISAKRVGAVPVAAKENELKTDINAIAKLINEKTKIIFIANPNNPTGSYLNKSEINELINLVPKNILIVLDHAYEEFVDKDDYPDAIDLVNKNNNIVVTRTFSKIYGLPSLRVGWCYSSEYIAQILNKIRGPFNVSQPAQNAAIAALNDIEFFNRSKNHNKKWLEIFYDNLCKLEYLKPLPSVANFILLDFGNKQLCKRVNDELLENGIILREMEAYNLENCLRMTIGNDDENSRVIELLTKF